MQVIRKTAFVVLGIVFLLSGCAPAQATQSPADIQAQIGTSVAMTVEVQNQLGTSVAQTVEAQMPAATETLAPTTAPLEVPTLTPIFDTATPFVVVPPSSGGGGGGGGSTTANYACDPDTGKKPRDNTVFRPGDPFEVKWTIINTGTKTWVAGKDFSYFSGPKMTAASGVELPELKPGKSVSFNFGADAPAEKGFQVMTWKVEGGFCYPYIAIDVEPNR
jgi:Ig-like domain from next to BRCA1 gene